MLVDLPVDTYHWSHAKALLVGIEVEAVRVEVEFAGTFALCSRETESSIGWHLILIFVCSLYIINESVVVAHCIYHTCASEDCEIVAELVGSTKAETKVVLLALHVGIEVVACHLAVVADCACELRSVWLFNRHICYQPSRTDIIPIFFYWEVAIAVGLCFVGSNYLPLIDFRPYRPGVNILDAMQTPGAAQEIEYRCVYEKDGKREEFALDNLPAEGSGWTFVETLELATSTGDAIKTEEPLIKDFFIFDEFGGDLTEEVLGDTAYTFLLLSPSLEIADETYIDRIENLYEYSIEHGYRFYCLTLNDSVQIASWKYRTGAEYDYLYSDATIIETMIRSNPGVMLLKEGTILWKSCLSKLDVDAVTSAKLTEQTYGQINSDNRKTKVFWLVFLMLAPFIVYLPIEKAFLAYKASKASKAQKATDKKKERQSK